MNNNGLIRQLPILMLILLTTALPARADGSVEARLTPSQNELTVGDRIELTLEVTHPADYQVIIPQLQQNWGPFEVQGQSQATTVANDDGSATTRQTITVTLFDLGTFETPALPLTITDDRGQVMQEEVPSVSLTVKPTLAEGDTELKDIRPQVAMKTPSALPWILTGLLMAVAVAGVGWHVTRRWRNKRTLLAPFVDNRLPHQVAFDELDRIDSLKLPEVGAFKEHYTLVADCLRAYIERQFRVHAFDRTTTELKQSLRGSTMSPDHARRFIDLFAESDLVKFAKLIPDREVARQLTQQARVLVELTIPVPEVEPGEAPQPSFGIGHPQTPVEVAQ